MEDRSKNIWNYLVDNRIGFSKKVQGKWVPVSGSETEHIIDEILSILSGEDTNERV